MLWTCEYRKDDNDLEILMIEEKVEGRRRLPSRWIEEIYWKVFKRDLPDKWRVIANRI